MKVWCSLLGLIALFFALASQANAEETGRGALVPWVTYEAEQARTSGSVLGPDYTGRTPAREASGRECVQLNAQGQFIEFVARSDAQGMVIRYCIPDSPDGRGTSATLSLYINGQFRDRLAMTSRFTYLYGEYPFNNRPASGSPRHFWDEVRVMPGTMRSGDVIRLQKDAGDVASQYLIDFVDLEQIPAALERPARSVSITDYGAIADGKTDAHPAFVKAISAAKKHHEVVWIPTGQFMVKGPVKLSDVTVCGAGMWYSKLVGAEEYTPTNRVSIYGDGSNVHLSDFAIVGNLNYRKDDEDNDGLGGSFGTGSSIRNIWVEHTKTGAWLVNSDGLVVEGCRFRDTIADGINLCLGMRNTLVRNCTSRGTGDDCFAIWPATYHKSVYSPGGNRIVNCTAQLPSLAQGFSVYGGDGNSVENCKAIDIPYGAGVLASTMFPTEFGFRGMTTFRGIDMTRAGCDDGAIAVMTNLVNLTGLQFADINVIDSPTDGIKFNCIRKLAVGDAAFDNIRIENAGVSGRGYGIVVASGAVGSATLNNVTVIHPKTSGYSDNASTFNLIRGSGNVGVEASTISGSDFSDARSPS